MSAFRDIYLPVGTIGFPMGNAPRWSTKIVTVSSSASHRDSQWADPKRRFDLPEAIRDWPTFSAVQKHWLAMRGPLYTFPLRDPLDCATRDMEAPNVAPATSGLDQFFGVGDGVTRTFQLTKDYTVSGPADAETYTRTINLPVVDTVEITVSGQPAASAPGGPYAFDVTREGGKVTFDKPPLNGQILKWGGLFDVNVRFESDDTFDSAVKTYRVAGFANMTLIEELLC